jgi:hypothetical protein
LWLYFQEHKDVLATARALNALDSDLIQTEVIGEIEKRLVPSDEWFLSNGHKAENLAEAKVNFLKEYHK